MQSVTKEVNSIFEALKGTGVSKMSIDEQAEMSLAVANSVLGRVLRKEVQSSDVVSETIRTAEELS